MASTGTSVCASSRASQIGSQRDERNLDHGGVGRSWHKSRGAVGGLDSRWHFIIPLHAPCAWTGSPIIWANHASWDAVEIVSWYMPKRVPIVNLDS